MLSFGARTHGHEGATGRKGRRRGMVALGAGVCAVVLAACNPGAVSNVVGNGTSGNSGDGAAAVDAQLTSPSAIAVDPNGGYYVVDTVACVIRKVDTNNTITTVAGTGTCGYSGDGGQATSAMIDPTEPNLATDEGWLVVLPNGNLVLADSGNNRLRVITTSGLILTIFQASGACTGSEFGVLGLGGLAYANNKFYLACGDDGVFLVTLDGTITPVAGIIPPFAMATAADGNALVVGLDVDQNTAVQEITAGGAVTTVATIPTPGVTVPNGLAVGVDGELYVMFSNGDGSTFGAGTIVRINADQSTTLVAGNGSPDPGSVLSGKGTDLAMSPRGSR